MKTSLNQDIKHDLEEKMEKENLIAEKDILKGDLILPITEKVKELFREREWMNKSNTTLKTHRGGNRFLYSVLRLDENTFGVKQHNLYREEYHYKNDSYNDKDKVVDGYEPCELLKLLDEHDISYSIEKQSEREFEFEHKGFALKITREFGDKEYQVEQDEKKTTSKYEIHGISGRWGEDVLKAINNVKRYIDDKIKNFEETGTYSGIKDVKHDVYTLENGNITADISIKTTWQVDKWDEAKTGNKKPQIDNVEYFAILKADGNIVDVRRGSSYKQIDESSEDCMQRVKKGIKEDFESDVETIRDHYKFHGEYKRW